MLGTGGAMVLAVPGKAVRILIAVEVVLEAVVEMRDELAHFDVSAALWRKPGLRIVLFQRPAHDVQTLINDAAHRIE